MCSVRLNYLIATSRVVKIFSQANRGVQVWMLSSLRVHHHEIDHSQGWRTGDSGTILVWQKNGDQNGSDRCVRLRGC